jgi:tetratricopeptide (TPR) repeat protein
MRVSKRAKRRFLILGVIMLGFVGVIVTFAMRTGQQQDLRLGEARAEGMAAFEAGDYPTALQKLSYVMSHDKEDVEVLVTFATTRSIIPTENNRHFTEAIGIYRRALDIDPTSVEAMSGLLRMYERTGLRVEAMELADRLLRTDEGNIDALSIRALIHYADSRFDAAERDTQRLIELDPADVRWRALHLQILQTQDTPLAELLAVCDAWDTDAGGDGRFRLIAAQLLISAGLPERAVAAARDAAARGASEADVLQQLLSLLDVLQLRDEARSVIEQTLAEHPDAMWPHEARVRRHWQANQLLDAVAAIDALREDGRTLSSELLQWDALLRLTLGELGAAKVAIGQLESLLERSTSASTSGAVPVRPSVRADRNPARGWLIAMQARLDADDTPWLETVQAYRRAIAMSPREAVLHYLLGEALMDAGEHELAALALEQASQSDPNWLAAQVAYAQALLSAGRIDQALERSHELLRRTERPGLTAYTLFARAWLESGRPNEGLGLVRAQGGGDLTLLDMLDMLYESDPAQPEVRELFVFAALRYGRNDLLQEIAGDVLADDDAPASLLAVMARLSRQVGLELEDALIARSHQLHGITLETAEFEATRAADAGDPERGRRIIREAIDALGGDADALTAQRLMAAYLARVEHADAVSEIAKLLEFDDPAGSTAIFVLSLAPTWLDRNLNERAIDSLAKVLGDTSPRVVLARANFVLQHQAGDDAALAHAQVAVNELLQRMPASLAALNVMSQLALKGSRPDPAQAIRFLERALSAHPNRSDLYLRLIPLLQQQGDFASAATYIEQMRALVGSDPDLRRAEVDFWRWQGDFDRALARLSDGFDASAPEADQLLYVAHLHRVGRHEEALERLERLLRAAAPSEAAVELAASIYADLGRFEAGLELIERASFTGGDAQRSVTLGRYFQYAGRADDAVRHLRRAMELDERNVPALAALISVELGRGNMEQAYGLARRGLQIDAANSSFQNTLVLTAMELGAQERAEAMALLGRVETADDAVLQTLRLYSRLRQDGKFSSSRADLADARQLTQKFPLFMPAWRLAIMVHVDAGDREEAIRLARQAATRLPNVPDPAEMATRLLAEAERFEESLEMARNWKKRARHQPVSPDMAIAANLLALGRAEEARRQIEPHAQRVMREVDDRPQFAVLWLHALLRSGTIAQAADHFGPLVLEFADWRRVWFEIVEQIDQSGAQQAIELMEESLIDTPEGRFALALAWASFGQRHDVESAYVRARDLAIRAGRDAEQFAVPALVLQGQIAESLDDIEQAIGFYRQAITADPDQVLALNNLAYRLAQLGRECDDARRFAARARELAPNVPEILHTHALALHCLGEYVQSETAAREAIALRPESSDMHITLGLALAGQQRWQEAREALATAERSATGRSSNAQAWRTRLDSLRQLVNAAPRGG